MKYLHVILVESAFEICLWVYLRYRSCFFYFLFSLFGIFRHFLASFYSCLVYFDGLPLLGFVMINTSCFPLCVYMSYARCSYLWKMSSMLICLRELRSIFMCSWASMCNLDKVPLTNIFFSLGIWHQNCNLIWLWIATTHYHLNTVWLAPYYIEPTPSALNHNCSDRKKITCTMHYPPVNTLLGPSIE